ncbi:acetaldehyde dehydrogenase (acetylating) [Aneurinibacillus tyrosinisolvens]|uniref:acetaldehyde dehydrogenase (acetylating) n=1 Tax=Aneurinibacillus tyrosinisolvens TaxID=1443435 RepID=UPI00069B2AEE|nr:acetaldehyde dehydrogenase (acetylating) [Aneurinibacillus tyrosinisolvens]
MQLDRDLQSLQEMRNAVRRAKEAQQEFKGYSQQQVDRIVKAMADAAYEKAYELGLLAVEETGLGIAEHKAVKNQVGSRDVYDSICHLKTVGVINEIPEKKMVEVASPFGVIAGIVPVTNPTSTAIFKSLIAVKTRNAIVFSPHPSAARCTVEAARVCLEAAVKAGAPDGLIGWIEEPTMEATECLMKHRDVNLILATGGGGLVRAAYSSGKPAYGVGPGNVPVYIEKTAEIAKAVKRIVDSKTFDNGTICASEQAIVVDSNIREMVIREFKNQGAYFLNEEEKRKLEPVISPAPGKLNPGIVGRKAAVIAGMAGLTVPPGTRLLIAEETSIGKDVPFSLEKLSPVFALYTVNGPREAVDVCEKLLALGGRGHTLALHTTDDEVATLFALRSPVSRIVVNTPAALGAVGATTGLMASLTLGCGTFGGNITSDNLTAHHLMNIKRMAYGTKEVVIPEPGSKAHVSVPPPQQMGQEKQIEEVVEKVLAQVGVIGSADKQTVAQLVTQVLAKL